MSTVVLEHASFGYRRRPVVADVSCEIAPARCLGVYGANGAGKSTLLRGVTGLLRPMSGRVAVTPRTKFEYLPQQRATESHWPMTVLDAASLATSARRWFGRVGRTRIRIREQLRELEVDDLARRPFFELSGGQQQRVLLAGALAAEPDVLLLDEPTSGLDERSRKLLLARLLRAKLAGLSLVVVSHDLEDLAALADTTIRLQSGEDPSQPSYSSTRS